MAGIVYELIDTLEEERECYEGLCTLAKYKEEAIVNKQIDFLQEVVKREEEFAGRVSILERRRDALLNDIAIVTGISAKEINVTRLIEKLGEENEASKRLIALRTELLDKIEGLKKQNELNTLLIDHSLELINFTIKAIESTRLQMPSTSYSKDGDQPGMAKHSFFDQKQ
ncbi:hypothetical protein CS063_13435 [Sporanaerobium hydrogeniformans]|uniref:Uncharacterized protein n=1 Tax=Sporanaerobium hydrogeniformans TaxID=3072179 RepID=A0AC61DAS1_9FIRM|nr:flagellar protein FlgN [Sporanaerobium hydrogeniformans]PHV69836.1 hypothetical protein CS063_13435 [Sporanaerobium hydrogeniformans]